jgi:hypothetical protein
MLRKGKRMNKFSCIKILKNNGDSILTLTNEPDICATIDFSTKYIKDKRYGRYAIEKNAILVFSWTDDKFRNIEVKNVKSIKPLSEILNNVGKETNHEYY